MKRVLRRIWRPIRRFLYGPPNWLVEKFSSEDRRMLAFWVFIVAALLTPVLGAIVLYVTSLSVIALAFGFLSETPVELESEETSS